MGWWPWSSSTTGASEAPSDANNNNDPNSGRFGLTEQQRLRIFGPSGAKSTESESNRATPAKDQADAELEAFLQSFNASDVASAPPVTDGVVTSSPAQQQSTAIATEPDSSVHDRILSDGSLNIHPSALHPRTMSCRAAFDQAFYCQSVGGKFNDIYRFGQLRDCSEQWGAFWFCMRTRTLPEHEKQNQIRDYYEQRDMRRKTARGSSEDVWEIRTTAVEKAFGKDPDADDEPHEPLVRA